MKILVIFDMDGTLADTSPGIINCHKHAHSVMGRKEPSHEELMGVIGGPLLQTYETRFGFSKDEARKAVDEYRARYAQQGIFEAELYDGIANLLKALKAKNVYLGVATLKAERFAKVMLQEMGIADLFDIICGVDEKDSRTKAQLIKMCMQHTGIGKEDAVLVGDSRHDLNGAKETGIDFIGVTYGFGFSKDMAAPECILCDHPDDVLRILNEGNIGNLKDDKRA